jgi:hypothetical protein
MSDGREADGPGTDGLSRKELLARGGAIGAGAGHGWVGLSSGVREGVSGPEAEAGRAPQLGSRG